MIYSWSTARRPEGTRVYLAGEIDISVSDHLYKVLGDTFEQTLGSVEVDLQGMRFLDCTGLSAFLRARQDAHAGGRLMFISRPEGMVRRVLEITDTLIALTSDAPLVCRPPTTASN